VSQDTVFPSSRLVRTAAPQGPRKRVLLCVTPFCSPNYTYPAPAYLARYLRRRGYDVHQADLSLELLLKMFCRNGLARLFAAAEPRVSSLSPESQRLLAMKQRYLSTVEVVIHYLQGRDASLAYRLAHPTFLPRGDHFEKARGFDWGDGNGNTVAIHDRAKYLGTLYLYDLATLFREAIFPYLQITLVDRLYDSYIHWCATFDAMRHELERPPNELDLLLHESFDEHFQRVKPDLVGVTAPFARNLYWALRIGRRAKELAPKTQVAIGGGLINTSMRHPSDPRLFDYVDWVTLDDGEVPLENILESMSGRRHVGELKRTYYRDPAGAIAYGNGSTDQDAAHTDTGAPDYTGYRVRDYFSTLETINVNQRVRSDGWWNKMTMAHGCYWKKCSFCDIHLSYVGDYDTASAKNLVDKVEEAIEQTGHTGFHFVDEAMPPKIMRDFAIEVLRRGLTISWHGMMRFDKTYSAELCKLLAASGLIVIMGGLEVASNRLLQLMKKGTTVEQVAAVAKNFQEAGIKVHAYIMYGFPTQTAQETIDALDVVRQMFKYGLITSASWAKFGVTPHSPIGREPGEYKIQLEAVPDNAFIEQIIPHKDPTGADHDQYTKGLNQALHYYGVGMYYDVPSENWFDFPVPQVSIDRDLVGKVLQERAAQQARPDRADKRVLWLGEVPTVRAVAQAAGAPLDLDEPPGELVLREPAGDHRVAMPLPQARWLAEVLARARPSAQGPVPMAELEASFSGRFGEISFTDWLASPTWRMMRERGLVLTELG
jgi:radical SAM superfamily enzyme YgiQ (UPF0313 family)